MSPLKQKQNRLLLSLCFVLACAVTHALAVKTAAQQPAGRPASHSSSAQVPRDVMLRIVRAEDERRWDNDLISLLSDKDAAIRSRAALAAGRIGDPMAVLPLVSLLETDEKYDVRTMAAFALGETEAAAAADALAAELKRTTSPVVKARAVEALGKIVAALPPTEEARKKQLGKAILDTLALEDQRMNPNSDTILLGLTAVLRARPDGAGKVVAQFLSNPDARIRADAGNTLARLKANDGNDQLRKLLTTDPVAIVRANAARVLGATQDKASVDGLMDRAQNDEDSRVRVSAIRALAVVKDPSEARSFGDQLLKQGGCRRRLVKKGKLLSHVRDLPDCLELITAVGKVFQGAEDREAYGLLRHWSDDFSVTPPEVEVALARISPSRYLSELGPDAMPEQQARKILLQNWRPAVDQGLAQIAALPNAAKDKMVLTAKAQDILRAMLDIRDVLSSPVQVHFAVPDVMRSYAAFKPVDLSEVLRKHLKESDVIVRATAAELLGELPPDETNANALVTALPEALADKQLNDAALSILDSLAKQKSPTANEAIKSALGSSDRAVRSRASGLLKENGAGDLTRRIGNLQSRNTSADYLRAISRIGKSVRAIVSTTKGAFTIELLPDDAPLNVDNFVQLAKRRYFNGITFHRVVPNFVVQGGDPRGDGNGGPGYAIRCEINEMPYERGAVGMALSGKDTGGSQWFVTHSRQPHLDGGYTVFGRVISGMNVVDRIVRGDVINSITISEG